MVGSKKGRRPCIAMSRRSVNIVNPIVVIPMTSNAKKPIRKISHYQHPKSFVTLRIKHSLLIVCTVRQVFAVNKRKLEDKFGKLSHLALLSVPLGLAYLF